MGWSLFTRHREYYRYVEANSTVKSIAEDLFNVYYPKTHSQHRAIFFFSADDYESANYGQWAVGEGGRTFNNATWQKWSTAEEMFLAYAMIYNDGRKDREAPRMNTAPDNYKMDNWGASLGLLNSMETYLSDTSQTELLEAIEATLFHHFDHSTAWSHT